MALLVGVLIAGVLKLSADGDPAMRSADGVAAASSTTVAMVVAVMMMVSMMRTNVAMTAVHDGHRIMAVNRAVMAIVSYYYAAFVNAAAA